MQPSRGGDYSTVPSADGMSDEIFLRHLDKRHIHELADDGPLAEFEHWNPLVLQMYRTFHDRLHAIAVAGQHDHEHLL